MAIVESYTKDGADEEFASKDLSDPETVNALTEDYASRETQDVVEVGRLNDGILTGRFGVDRVLVAANAMQPAVGSPSFNALGSVTPTWRLDAALQEGVSFSVMLPRAWDTFDVYINGANGGAGAGDVQLKCLHGPTAPGEDYTAGYTGGAAEIFTASAQNIRQQIRVRENLVANESSAMPYNASRTHTFRVIREGDQAGDTLANDWAIASVELVAKTYRVFEPVLPEEPENFAGRTFTQDHNFLIDSDLRIWMQAPPPDDDLDADDPLYPYFPLTDNASATNFTPSNWSLGNRWIYQWIFRCNFGGQNTKPNTPIPPIVKVGTKECRVVYTTLAKAQAATRATVRHILGGFTDAEIRADWLAAGGIAGDIITEAQWRASPGTYCTTDWEWLPAGSDTKTIYRVATDKVVLPTGRLSDGPYPALNKGVVLDYEVGDSRSPASTLAHVTNLIDDIHSKGKEAFFYTNPLTSIWMTYHGLDDANLAAIFDLADYSSVLLWGKQIEGSVSAGYTAQIAKFGAMSAADWQKVVLIFELGSATYGTTLEDATWVRNKIKEAGTSHPTKVMFWRNYAPQGGDENRLTNKKISMITLGTEFPPAP